MLLGYRWYFPGWGRFLTPDPTGQEANHYAYAHNDPVNNTDPTGSSIFSTQLATIFGYAGAAIGGALVLATCPPLPDSAAPRALLLSAGLSAAPEPRWARN